MQEWSSRMNNPEVPVNENFQALAWAAVYAKNAVDTSGLDWAYYGGQWSGFEVAGDSVALTDDATNYIVVARADGALSVSTSTTNWNDTENFARVYQVAAASGLVESALDFRSGQYGVHGAIDTVAAAAPSEAVNVQTGTTYDYEGSDAGSLVVRANGSPMTDTLPDIEDAPAGWWVDVQNRGAGLLTIETQGSPAPAINDDTSIDIEPGFGVRIVSDGTDFHVHGALSGSGDAPPDVTQCIAVAVSDEGTALTTGTAKVRFRMPYAMTLSEVRASLSTAQGSGSIFTVDINEGGSTILSTKLTIDNTEKTSKTAATPAVISDTSLADDAEITVDIDQVGASGAAGLKVYLIGVKA